MTARADETADPLSRPRRRGDDGRPGDPAVVLAFHPDLRRVGEIAWLDPRGKLAVVGRDAPVFERSPGEPAPLLDPCISRVQLRVGWVEGRKAFRVERDGGARRPLSLVSAAGVDLGDADEVPPGTFVALGDRALLLLAHLPRERGAHLPAIVGRSPAMIAVRERIRLLAPARDPALVLGETGTGKELAARGLHLASARRGGPFVAVNCAALPETLVESELFGHARGAFTGAVGPQPGLFREASGGTLFLDEIGELPLPTQAKLLRVLEEGVVRPVGGAETKVDVRVVGATNRDLEAAVRAGTFRADLAARLGHVVALPPLRDRRVDLPLLFAHLLLAAVERTEGAGVLVRDVDRFAAPVPLDHVVGLLGRPWERNVRELAKHTAELALAAARHGSFVGDGAPPPEEAAPRPRRDGPRPSAEDLAAILERHDHVAQRAAAELGVSPATLLRWLREAGITRPSELGDAEIARALAASDGDLAAAARALRVSVRGLRLRLGERG